MSGSEISGRDVLQLILRVSLVSVATYFSLKWMISQIDPTSKTKKKFKEEAESIFKKLKKHSLNSKSFTDHEMVIASNIIVPEDIKVSWTDIAGLDHVVEELRESVIYPVTHKDLFAGSQLCQAPKGVLLHGPPGCGKTLIAKATAKEAGMIFISLDVSMLTDKWYGESQKLASAVFSLASKIQPCIIFIDEIDSFLRSRNSTDHEATAMMKTQFMMLWDGLNTDNSNVIIMGATNRPQDLDKAILRRMPAQFLIGLPNESQRLKILKLILDDVTIETDVDLIRLSKLTNHFSGSDLRELCRTAASYAIRLHIRKEQELINSGSAIEGDSSSSAQQQRAHIKMEHILSSFNKMKESKMHTGMLAMDNRIDLD